MMVSAEVYSLLKVSVLFAEKAKEAPDLNICNGCGVMRWTYARARQFRRSAPTVDLYHVLIGNEAGGCVRCADPLEKQLSSRPAHKGSIS